MTFGSGQRRVLSALIATSVFARHRRHGPWQLGSCAVADVRLLLPLPLAVGAGVAVAALNSIGLGMRVDEESTFGAPRPGALVDSGAPDSAARVPSAPASTTPGSAAPGLLRNAEAEGEELNSGAESLDGSLLAVSLALSGLLAGVTHSRTATIVAAAMLTKLIILACFDSWLAAVATLGMSIDCAVYFQSYTYLYQRSDLCRVQAASIRLPFIHGPI